MLADFRYAVRRWVARPAFTTTAVLTLALGIGAATAIFSVLEAVILRPLPWKEPDRLVTMWIVRPEWKQTPVLAAGADRGMLSWPNFRDAQQQSHAFEAIGVWGRSTPIVGGDVYEVARGMFVSSSFLPMLGVQPHLGRFFERVEDEQPTDSVLVSYEAWRRRFGGSPHVLGTRVVLDDQPRTIVGVLPPRFEFEGPVPEFLLPFGQQSAANRTRENGAYFGVARLKPSVTLQDALRDVEPILRAGDKPERRTARLERLADTQLGESRRPLWMLFSAAALLLLIACTNVAGLLLSDAAARRQEIAVRMALGAGRGQLVRALFAESAALGIAGAILGVVAAWLLAPVLVGLAPAALPRIDSLGLNMPVLVFSLGLMFLTTLLFGMGPALALSRVRPAGTRREGDATKLGRQRIQELLVIVQVALAFVLLAGAALLGQTVIHLSAAPTGFDAGNLVVLGVRGPRVPGETAASQSERTRLLQERLATLPGVISAAAAATVPFTGGYGTNHIEVDGERFAEQPYAARQVVTTDYLQAMRVPLVKGRYFSQQDGAEPVAVVSAEFERRYLRGHAIDRKLNFMGDAWYRVIGVVADTKQRGKADATRPTFYVLDKQVAAFSVNQFVLRTAGDPRSVFAAAREAVRTHDPRSVVLTLDTMSNRIRLSMASEEFRSTLAAVFGAAALLLALVGLYALLSRSVADRVHEIGVRMTLGARPLDVLRLVTSQGAALVALGLLVGMPAAFAASRLIASLLYGVSPTNALTYVMVAAALTMVSLLAIALPARRAGRIDPIAALRHR